LALAACAVLLLGGAAVAEPVTLRISTVSPEGTAWTRELRAFQRQIESETNGQVRIKWYLGAIAGDDLGALERVRRGQLDGIGGSIICGRLAPSMWIIRVVGLFETPEEVDYVIGRLKPVFDEEFNKAGFVNLIDGTFGADVLFSKTPVRNMADFRALRWWTWNGWNFDPIWQATLPVLGTHWRTTPIDQMNATYQRGEVDGFIAIPSAALAYQWSPLAKYFTDLPAAELPACLLLSHTAVDPLPLEQQQILRDAAAKLRARWPEVTSTLNQSLLGGLFEQQGLKKVHASPEFRSEFYAASRAARRQLDDKVVPHELLAKVERLLAEYRTQHHKR
jgi:TRAP-type C4-dicarboxylate transport system substrate-binding protein